MRYSDYVREELDKHHNKKVKAPLEILQKNIDGIKEYCKEDEQDWVFMVVGAEGSGKSTLGLHLLSMLDPNVHENLKESMIYSFRGENGYLDFFAKYQDTPYKVTMFDEAVTALFSRDYNSKDSKYAIKLFKINRDCKHFNILIAPAFWDLDLDIRQRRTKTLLYTFKEKIQTQSKKKWIHKFAFYSGEKIVQICNNGKARAAFRNPKEFFKIVKPDFIEHFYDVDPKLRNEYRDIKRQYRRDLVMDILNDDGSKKSPQQEVKQHIKPAAKGVPPLYVDDML